MPPDEGNYAHIAQRMLAGEVLNLHLQDIAGYTNFLNAGAFALFGLDLLSLRYPLVLAALVQGCLVFWLFPRRAPALALVASVGLNALGLVQFLDPTAHWYCLFLLVAIAGALRWLPRTTARLVVVGVLLGLLALFRLLSGFLVIPGVLACLMVEAHGTARGREVILERILLGLTGAGLLLYLTRATDGFGWLLFGVWPLLVLLWIARDAAATNRQVLRVAGAVALGAVLASLPLWLYHLAHGSVGAWLGDLVALPRAGIGLQFMREPIYRWLALLAVLEAVQGSGLVNTIYWLTLLLAAALNALLVLRALEQARSNPRAVPALPLLAVFYALVSVHYQIPIYLHFSVGLSVASVLLLLAGGPGRRLPWAAAGFFALIACFAVRFHAGQPLSRALGGTVKGQRIALEPSPPLPRSHLWIPAEEHALYAELLGLIARETRADETIFSVPGNAELYFLSGRRNPFRFYNAALGITGEEALQRTEAALRAAPPRLVIYLPDNKYNTALSRRLMERIKETYTLVRKIGAFEIYRSPG